MGREEFGTSVVQWGNERFGVSLSLQCPVLTMLIPGGNFPHLPAPSPSQRDSIPPVHPCHPLTSLCQVRLRPRRVHPDHGVHVAHRHPGGDAPQVCQPHLLHPLLPEPLHRLALAGHCLCLRGHPDVHRGVEQPGALPGALPEEEEAEGGVNPGIFCRDLSVVFQSRAAGSSP